MGQFHLLGTSRFCWVAKMNKREKSWEKKRYLGRKKEKKNIRKILIVCEGRNTEPCYFKSFRIDKNEFKVEAIGKGYTPDRLVKEAIDMKQNAIDKQEPYYEVWCVFDKDDNTNEKFYGAIQTAEHNKIRAAYTNEAFELWYLLHFDYYVHAMPRRDYPEKLSNHLGFKYEKTIECSKRMYKELRDGQPKAIKRAKKLLTEPSGPKGNPSTTVHLLVEELNERLLPSEK
jgi:hypothetical protein